MECQFRRMKETAKKKRKQIKSITRFLSVVQENWGFKGNQHQEQTLSSQTDAFVLLEMLALAA